MAEALQQNVRVATYLRALGDVSAYKMRAALLSRSPPLDVSVGVLKQWMSKYRSPDDAVSISGAEDLEKRYGAAIRHLAEDSTAYKLKDALSKWKPSLYVTQKTAETWLRKYGLRKDPVRYQSAEEMEAEIGKEIRAELAVLLTKAISTRDKPVLISEQTCAMWLEKYGHKVAAGQGGESRGSIRKKPAAKPYGAFKKRMHQRKEQQKDFEEYFDRGQDGPDREQEDEYS